MFDFRNWKQFPIRWNLLYNVTVVSLDWITTLFAAKTSFDFSSESETALISHAHALSIDTATVILTAEAVDRETYARSNSSRILLYLIQLTT